MSQSDAPRPGIAAVFLGLPVVLGLLLLLSLGLLALATYLGGGVHGDRLQIHFVTECGSELRPMIQARAEAIGLGDPVLRLETGEVVL
ncbi:MAG: hypothetical protein QGG40_09975, partial [Myxococcota bacterium]|nr:hypothetical protein [Myxococcota bacterium]